MKFEIIPQVKEPSVDGPFVTCDNPGSPVDKLSFTIWLGPKLTESYFDEKWDLDEVVSILFPFVAASCSGLGADTWHLVYVGLHDEVADMIDCYLTQW